MTNAAPALHPTGLNFEVQYQGAGAHFSWEVFEPTSGKNIAEGKANSRELATQIAVRFIAERRSGLHVLRNRAGWIVWHREAHAWMPLPLTSEADSETVRTFVAALPLAAGKDIHVIRD